ncbi:hypothetical protein ACFQDD_00465 [Halorubrum pallidum]|uniref:Uncharacterized protein n=1 Tax=Halorubrum pallidum TaxID=1526114 RepID=A0ABD5SZS6_9EURY
MTVALLPLHHGSIHYPPHPPEDVDGWPPEVVLKHCDGELIQVGSLPSPLTFARRGEYDASYVSTGEEYVHFPKAVATAADKQAFGYRQNGESASMLTVADDPETIAVEPRNRGGVLVQSPAHLPFGVYLTTGEAYRARLTTDTDQPQASEAGTLGRDSTKAVVEYRSDNVAEWEQLGYAIPTELSGLLQNTIGEPGEHTSIPVLSDPSSGKMEDVIEANYDGSEVFDLPQTDQEEEIIRRTGMNSKTVFPPTHPVPTPLFE